MKKRINKYILIGIVTYQFFLLVKIVFFNKIKDECADITNVYQFIDSSFRKENGLVRFDTIGKHKVVYKSAILFSGNDNDSLYPSILRVSYYCKDNYGLDYFKISRDSIIKVFYHLDSLNASSFFMVHENKSGGLGRRLKPSEAYKRLIHIDLYNTRFFYGYNKDSLDQLLLAN